MPPPMPASPRSSRPTDLDMTAQRGRERPFATPDQAPAGSRTFHCHDCGYPVTILRGDRPPACPACGARAFERASMFAETRAEALPIERRPPRRERAGWLAEAREGLEEQDCYIAFEDVEGRRLVALVEGLNRVGRSRAAQVRLDDPTVSRRHAILHRAGREVTVVDDHSLNGVFVDGRRIQFRTLDDGDEISVGRFHLNFVRGPEAGHSGGSVS